MNDDFSFNLITEPWVPCVRPDGRTVEKGLLETLSQAHEITGVFDPSPLVTAALHRLLLAVLHRNFGPKSNQVWRHIWEAGRFERQVLEDYFDRWKGRFDLFDDEHPFYQVMEFPKRFKTDRAAVFRQELAGGNNPTLFDHTLDIETPWLRPGEAARHMISFHCYGLGGLCVPGISFTDAPAARHVTLLVRGRNLFETLCLNFIRYPRDRPIPAENDLPAWEAERPEFERKTPRGYLDFLTWQGRSIRLVPQANEKGEVIINAIEIWLGRPIESEDPLDPLTAWRKDEKRGWVSLRLHEGRALWRDSTAILSQAGEKGQPPLTLELLAELKMEEVLDPEARYTIDAIGMGSFQARIDFWRHEHMPLPLAYLGDSDLVKELNGALDWANDGAAALRGAVWAFASIALAPGERTPDRNDVRNYVDHLAAEGLYWSRLEEPFHRLLIDLPAGLDAARKRWQETVVRTARGSFEEAVRDTDRSARMHKALVRAEAVLNSKLRHLRPGRKEGNDNA